MPGEDEVLSDMRKIVIVADDPVAAAEAEASIMASGLAAPALRSSWSAASAAIAAADRPPPVFADARGVTRDVLSEHLPGLADSGRSGLVVAFDPDQIDVVAGALLATDAILLCEASEAERATAVALAAADTGLTVHDSSREADRLQQLSAEVARFAETLARLTGTDGAAGRNASADPFVAEQSRSFGAEPVAIDASDIRRAIRARRMRDDAFGASGLFEDPAWDMLLDLFAAELERRQVSVSSLCIAAAVAPTTALRWIGKLIDARLLERRPDDLDRRRAFISLSAKASMAMRHYVAAVRRAGLAIA